MCKTVTFLGDFAKHFGAMMISVADYLLLGAHAAFMEESSALMR